MAITGRSAAGLFLEQWTGLHNEFEELFLFLFNLFFVLNSTEMQMIAVNTCAFVEIILRP